MKAVLTKKIQFRDGKVLWEFLLNIKNDVLNVESDHFAGRQFLYWIMRNEGETFEDELMVIVIDYGWCSSLKRHYVLKRIIKLNKRLKKLKCTLPESWWEEK